MDPAGDSSIILGSDISLPTAQDSAQEDFPKASKESLGGGSAQEIVPSSDVYYTWSNLRVEHHTKTPFWKKPKPDQAHTKVILNDVSGCARSGELWALMGSSGAGKTTLLNALNFRPTFGIKASGARCLNGLPVTAAIISTVSAYVEQDDLMNARMTVLEHLNFNALLRFSSAVSGAARKARVEEVMKELGLWAVRDNYIGSASTVKGISGGEMKRLSFASEILTDPAILFCDEPTSGLDSFMAATVVDVMKKMTESGRLIICTIHQPSSEIFALFDHLYLMVEGRVAYAGPRDGAVGYFANLGYVCPETHNPADFLIRLLAINPDYVAECRKRADEFVAAFQASELNQRIEDEVSKVKAGAVGPEVKMLQDRPKSKFRASRMREIYALSWRNWILFVRDPVLLLFRLAQALLVGVVLGTLFYGIGPKISVQGATSMAGLVYFLAMFCYFTGGYTGVSIVSPTIPLIVRENWKGLYHTSSYIISLMTMDVPFYLVYPLMPFPFVWWYSGMEGPASRFLREYFLLANLGELGCGVGYFSGAVSSSTKMGLIIITSLFVPTIMFASILTDTAGLLWCMRWIKRTSMLEYTAANLMIEQWVPVKDIYFTEPFVPELFGDGAGVLDYYGIYPEDYMLNLVVSLGITILVRFLAHWALRMKCARM